MGVPCQPRLPACQQGPGCTGRTRLGPRRCSPRTPSRCPLGTGPGTGPRTARCHPPSLLPPHPGTSRPARKRGFLLARAESEAMAGSRGAHGPGGVTLGLAVAVAELGAVTAAVGIRSRCLRSSCPRSSEEGSGLPRHRSVAQRSPDSPTSATSCCHQPPNSQRARGSRALSSSAAECHALHAWYTICSPLDRRRVRAIRPCARSPCCVILWPSG